MKIVLIILFTSFCLDLCSQENRPYIGLISGINHVELKKNEYIDYKFNKVNYSYGILFQYPLSNTSKISICSGFLLTSRSLEANYNDYYRSPYFPDSVISISGIFHYFSLPLFAHYNFFSSKHYYIDYYTGLNFETLSGISDQILKEKYYGQTLVKHFFFNFNPLNNIYITNGFSFYYRLTNHFSLKINPQVNIGFNLTDNSIKSDFKTIQYMLQLGLIHY